MAAGIGITEVCLTRNLKSADICNPLTAANCGRPQCEKSWKKVQKNLVVSKKSAIFVIEKETNKNTTS